VGGDGVNKLAVSSIKRDFALQPRATLHQEWIEEYALDLANGAKLPAVIVFFDGNDYWLADGFHRAFAHESLGLIDIEADIRRGTRRDALLFSVGANAIHGHRRTNDDKRRAVDIMLADPEWVKWSDNEIAKQCGVVQSMVTRARPSYAGHKIDPDPVRTVTRNGTTYPMRTGNIGASRERSEPSPEPETQTTPTPSPAPRPPADLFDHEAARIRESAMGAIRTLADQPAPADVINAWNKTMGFGEPLETLDRALAWLTVFAALYSEAEPIRLEKVQRARQRELSNAPE
jgi:hypothetical protein